MKASPVSPTPPQKKLKAPQLRGKSPYKYKIHGVVFPCKGSKSPALPKNGDGKTPELRHLGSWPSEREIIPALFFLMRPKPYHSSSENTWLICLEKTWILDVAFNFKMKTSCIVSFCSSTITAGNRKSSTHSSTPEPLTLSSLLHLYRREVLLAYEPQ